MSVRTGKFICPDCRKDLGKSVTRDSSLCKTCGRRICNYCHVAQKEECRTCARKAKKQEAPKRQSAKKKKFLIF